MLHLKLSIFIIVASYHLIQKPWLYQKYCGSGHQMDQWIWIKPFREKRIRFGYFEREKTEPDLTWTIFLLSLSPKTLIEIVKIVLTWMQYIDQILIISENLCIIYLFIRGCGISCPFQRKQKCLSLLLFFVRCFAPMHSLFLLFLMVDL